MTIVSSVTASDSPQKDGRRWIEDHFTDQTGKVYMQMILVAADFDAAADLPTRAANLDASLAASEIASNIDDVLTNGSLATPTLIYSTAAQNFAALRALYSSATQLQAIMAGDFLSTLTNGQLQTAFGLTAGQVTTLRTNKLTPAANAAATIRATTGA
jgi:hypothetical protein